MPVRQLFLVAVAASAIAFGTVCLAQTDEADVLDKQIIALYQAGKYAEAIPLAQQALAIREKLLKPDDPAVATALYILAALYTSQGRYADAEPLSKRALAIYEKALGPDHQIVALSLNNLGGLYDSQGR